MKNTISFPPCLGADQKARGLWERDCEKQNKNEIKQKQTGGS